MRHRRDAVETRESEGGDRTHTTGASDETDGGQARPRSVTDDGEPESLPMITGWAVAAYRRQLDDATTESGGRKTGSRHAVERPPSSGWLRHLSGR